VSNAKSIASIAIKVWLNFAVVWFRGLNLKFSLYPFIFYFIDKYLFFSDLIYNSKYKILKDLFSKKNYNSKVKK